MLWWPAVGPGGQEQQGGWACGLNRMSLPAISKIKERWGPQLGEPEQRGIYNMLVHLLTLLVFPLLSLTTVKTWDA